MLNFEDYINLNKYNCNLYFLTAKIIEEPAVIKELVLIYYPTSKPSAT